MKTKIPITRPLFWTLSILMILVCVLTTIEASGSGAEIAKCSHEEALANLRKQELTQELVKFSALTQIGSFASESGFNRPEATLYLSENPRVASRLP